MQVLLINEIAGPIDRLQAVLERARAAQVGAVFVLSNMVPGTRRSQAAATLVSVTNDQASGRADTAAREDALAQARYIHILHVLGALGVPVYLVPGERDGPLVGPDQMRITAQGPGGLRLLHRQAARLGDETIVIGFGGVPITGLIPHGLLLLPPKAPCAAFAYRAIFHPFFRGDQRRIVLFATAPCAARPDGAPARIVAFYSMLQTYRPHLICLGGPQQNGGVTVVERTPIVSPGALSTGSYALIELDRRTVRLERLRVSLPEGPVVLPSIVIALERSVAGWRVLDWRRACAGLSRSVGAAAHRRARSAGQR